MAQHEEQNERDDAGPQESTSELPMVDLSVVVDAVSKIREEAVENATMKDVAEALEYKAPTSTPFYRRIVAARLFGLLTPRSASLTQAAIDYIKPHDEQMKSRVLREAVYAVPAYQSLLQKYSGKKLNTALVANAIAKDHHLTDVGSMACAKAFEGSIRFAGMISNDGIVDAMNNGGCTPRPTDPPEAEKITENATKNGLDIPRPITVADFSADTQHHTLFLDKDKLRKFDFTGPLELTRAEYDRICKWLQFTMLIIEPDEKSEGAETKRG